MTEVLPANPQSKPAPHWRRSISSVSAWLKEKVFGGIVLLIIASVSAWLWSRAADVRYTIGEVAQLDVTTGRIDVSVVNKGSLSAEDVDCEIKVTSSDLKAITCEPSIFKATVAIDPDQKRANINIPRINPTEAIKLRIEATNPFQLEKTMKVAVRGKDIAVSKAALTQHPSFFAFVVFDMWPFYLPLLAFALLKVFLQPRLEARIAESKIKMFRFLNGPMAGRNIAWPDSKGLYEDMTRQQTILKTGGATYFVWSRRETDFTISFEMVCNDVIPIEHNGLEVVAEVQRSDKVHLL